MNKIRIIKEIINLVFLIQSEYIKI